MICRLVIITIIILLPISTDLSQKLSTFSTVILVFIPISLKPYDHKILNIFDGLILHLMVFVTLIPFADNLSQQISTASIIILIILPLILLIALELIVHKQIIKTGVTKMIAKFKTKTVAATNDNNEEPIGNIGLVIDDNMRKNATICEMYV